jgi:hypothetical protein
LSRKPPLPSRRAGRNRPDQGHVFAIRTRNIRRHAVLKAAGLGFVRPYHAHTRCRLIEADDSFLSVGFHDNEPDNQIRWTDGDAAIPPELLAGFTGATEFTLYFGAKTRYLADGPVQSAA